MGSLVPVHSSSSESTAQAIHDHSRQSRALLCILAVLRQQIGREPMVAIVTGRLVPRHKASCTIECQELKQLMGLIRVLEIFKDTTVFAIGKDLRQL